MRKQCPKCGNWVEGKKVTTFARNVTRSAVKKGSAMATGAAIGSIIPGLGTFTGAAIGFILAVVLFFYFPTLKRLKNNLISIN